MMANEKQELNEIVLDFIKILCRNSVFQGDNRFMTTFTIAEYETLLAAVEFPAEGFFEFQADKKKAQTRET